MPIQGLAVVDRPKTRSRRQKSEEEKQEIEAPSPTFEAMEIDVQLEGRLSSVRRSLRTLEDAPELLVMDVDNTGPEGPKKKVRKMKSLATAPTAETTRLETKAAGKKKVVKR